ncbi:hypothetical protein GCM10020220_095420 [Nonomuraea rubra]|uniref:hypothetical protein n=1 Tax=Nonomuraea rubra TaxID=46180 RepID=UPI0031EE9E18
MLAEALTVEPVVQAIIDVGRTALAATARGRADSSTDRAALSCNQRRGHPEASGATGDEIPLSHST